MSNGLRTPVRVMMSVHEMADRIEELEAELEYWRKDSADAWDKCEENRLKLAKAEVIVHIIASDKWDERLGEAVDLSCEYLAELKGQDDG